MYRMHEDFDVSFLVGRLLLQVAIGVNEVILNFDEDFRICVTTDFDVHIDGVSHSLKCGNVESAACVLSLLGQMISATKVVNDTLLSITFVNGSSIDLKDDSDQFESFTIARPGSILVV